MASQFKNQLIILGFQLPTVFYRLENDISSRLKYIYESLDIKEAI